QRAGVDPTGVVEVVNGTARNEERLAGADVGRCALERPGQDPFEPVDRLVVAVVAVRSRDLGTGRDVELKDRHRATRLLSIEQEPDRHVSDLDLFTHARSHCGSFRTIW